MHANRRQWLVITLFLLILAMFGWQSLGGPQQRPAGAVVAPSPAVIGLINLERMYSGLHEQNAAVELLTNIQNQLQDEVKRLDNDVARLQEDVDLFDKGSAKQMEALDKLTAAAISRNARVEFAKAKIDFQESLQLKRLYLEIREHAAKFAKLHGYDLILLDDSIGDLPTGSAEETTRQISARRVIYADEALDITDELIEYMNAQFNLAQGPAAAAATP